MIIVDLSQIIIANCIVNNKELKKDPIETKNFIKHMAFTTLLSFKKKYSSEYGKMVLACDSKSYWRRDYFPAYKGHRKHSRDADTLNWDLIFESITEIKNDLRANFPYIVLEVDGAEADDIIACMTKYLQTNETVQEGLFDGEAQKIMILSSDGDFVQLQKYPTVKQWSPLQKKLVKPKGKVETYIMEHVCTGDSGDNIPNILTNDQWAIDRSKNDEATRQTPMRKNRLAEFVKDGINACKTTDEKRNFIRNQTLIDFDKIPDTIYSNIIDEYVNYKIKGSAMKLMSYFSKNRMALLFASIGDF